MQYHNYLSTSINRQHFNSSFARENFLFQLQSNDLAKAAFDQIMDLCKTQEAESIFISGDFQQVLQRVKSLEHHVFIFKCQFGSVISLKKQKSFLPTKVDLIFPKSWDFNCSINGEQIHYTACRPSSEAYFQIGVINEGILELNEERQLFLRYLKLQKSNLIKEVHYNPTFLLQAAKTSVEKINYEQSHRSIYRQNLSQFLKSTQRPIWQKGGSFDVGKNNGQLKPNTSLEVIQALLQYIFQNLLQDYDPQAKISIKYQESLIFDSKSIQSDTNIETYTHIIMLNYRLQQLKNKIKKEFLSKQELILVRKCLHDLIEEFKGLTNLQIKYNQITAKKEIQELFDLLNSKQGKATRPKITFEQLKNSVQQDGIQNSIPIYFDQNLINYSRAVKTTLSLSMDLGFSCPLKIIHKFQDLLNFPYDNHLWVILAQEFFFSLITQNFGEDHNEIQIRLSQVECGQKQFSILEKVIQKYEKTICAEEQYHGMKLINQVYSHIYLIKYIGAAVAFEVIRRQRTDKIPSLQNYKIPQNLGELYKNFTSLSFTGRRALANLIRYAKKNEHKSPIFILQDSKISYYNFAYAVSVQDPTIKKWIKIAKEKLQKDVQGLTGKFLEFEINYLASIKRHYQLSIQPCVCFFNEQNYEETKSRLVSKVQQYKQYCFYSKAYIIKEKVQKVKEYYTEYKCRTKKIMCVTCINLEKILEKIRSLKKQKTSYLYSQYALNQQNFFGFLKNIPSDILGMMKLIYGAQYQGDLNSWLSHSNLKNHFNIQYCPISIFAKDYQKGQFLLYENYSKDPHYFIRYPHENAIISYNNSREASPLKLQKLAQQQLNSRIKSEYQYLIKKPQIENNLREHEIYSKVQMKKVHQMQQYLAFANLRVAEIAQIPMLCQKLSNRILYMDARFENEKLKGKNDEETYAKLLILLNTIADINGFEQINNKQIKSLTLIKQSIQDLLKIYLDRWRFQDLYFLHVTGIVFSLLSIEVGKPNFSVQLAQKAYEQYQRSIKENPTPTNNLKSQWAFFLHGAMQCFTQTIIASGDRTASHCWAKIMVNYRINKIFSDQNILNPSYRQTMNFYKNFFERAICNNIEKVKHYFQNNLAQLTQIVRTVDKDISKNIVWSHDKSKGEYIFSGKINSQEYYINLYTGVIIKNGGEIKGLTQQIISSPSYVSIFGESRDMEVYPQKDGSLRTRCDFSKFFNNQPDTVILFQFQIINKNLHIRKIIKRQNPERELKYVLISKDYLSSYSNFVIPPLFLNQLDAWYCQIYEHFVFRQKSLNKMKNVGLVMLTEYKEQMRRLVVKECRIIQNKFKRDSIQYLREKNHSHFFDHIKFTTKSLQHDRNLAVKILTAIQKSQYIIELYSPDYEKNPQTDKIVKFWLHRQNLKFSYSSKNGLVSDNYQGYTVSQAYSSHQLLPWIPQDSVFCLVLKKFVNDLRMMKMHQYIILMPETNVEIKIPRITLPVGETLKVKNFVYQIHDHFKDIRSKTRLQQLYMALIISSIKQPAAFKPLMMNNIEYAIHILRSCINVKPLSPSEHKVLQNILINCINLNQHTLILMCQAVYDSTNLLRYILPYQSGKVQVEELIHIRNNFYSKKEIIQHSRLVYRQNFENNKISAREELNQFQLQLLSIDHTRVLYDLSKRRLSKWQDKNSLTCCSANNFEEVVSRILYALSRCEKLKKSILGQLVDVNITENEEKELKECLNLSNLNPEQRQCIMSKEQYEQILSSLRSNHHNLKKYDKLQLNESRKKILVTDVIGIITNLVKIREFIMKSFNQMQQLNEKHFDIISGHRSFLTERDFTDLLCKDQYFSYFFPQTPKKQQNQFKALALFWMKLTVEIDSHKRIALILNEKTLDKIALLRELESPRQIICSNVRWVCFEAEMKLKIWLSQYETYNLFCKSRSGSVVQLNMGEGKTQVIIPMLVLDYVYYKDNLTIPRVNILSSLYQEAQNNYYKFFSVTGFHLCIFPIYFNRTVKIDEYSLKRMQYAFDMFKGRALILIDRQSSLSLILKMRQYKRIYQRSMEQFKGRNKQDAWIFRDNLIIDIYDEVDALMTPKKSFVYAVGNSSPLPSSETRFQICRIFLEIIVKDLLAYILENELAILEESQANAQSCVNQGQFPKSLRFLTGMEDKKIYAFKLSLINLFLDKYLPPQFEFYKYLTESQKGSLIKYFILEQEESSILFSKNIPEASHEQLFSVRGLLAYGVLVHCLSLRNGVDYGCPGPEHPKRVGIPFQAADVPSKRSEYVHPEVATLLSYLTYFYKGLSYPQFEQALSCLLSQTQSSKRANYNKWVQITQRQSGQFLKQVNQINFQSDTQKEKLYQIFMRNRNTVIFWLVHRVFPKDLAQYKYSMTSSSWDLADSLHSLGFSGTKDSHWLFPYNLKLQESETHQINGTDGKMVQLMLQHSLDVVKIKKGQEDLWKRFCQICLKLNVGCIIDAGAILAGKSLEHQIVPWISKLESFDKKFKGISFCDQNGIWKVYDTSTYAYVERETIIPEHETFVIFDEARTRGADLKMNSDTLAALSLAPNMTKDKLMQAAGRLRKFGRNQKIIIVSTSQNLMTIKGFQRQNLSVKDQIKLILEWVCRNSIQQNKKLLYPNSKLAWVHFGNILSKNEYQIQEFDPDLKIMYKQKIIYRFVSEINDEIHDKFMGKYVNPKHQGLKWLLTGIREYGSTYEVKTHNMDDICERQVEVIQQKEKEVQRETFLLEPIPENQYLAIYKNQVTGIDFKFDPKLQFSQNFINCTRQSVRGRRTKNQFINNQLCQVNFVRVSKTLTIITQREMSKLISSGTNSVGLYELAFNQQNDLIARFSDLRLDTPCIKNNNLQNALIEAQFFNGNQNYKKKEHLVKFIRSNYERLKFRINLQLIVTHFLQRRGTLQNKYRSSDLEEIHTQIINTKLDNK